MHVWDEVDPALMQLDVYTCSALNVDDVFLALSDFVPVNVEFKYIDREHDLTLLDKGVISEILPL
jgi:S-adenosylmethionine/arginine decarboxylase-like enzyme